jgi:hypothetical protein
MLPCLLGFLLGSSHAAPSSLHTLVIV